MYLHTNTALQGEMCRVSAWAFTVFKVGGNWQVAIQIAGKEEPGKWLPEKSAARLSEVMEQEFVSTKHPFSASRNKN